MIKNIIDSVLLYLYPIVKRIFPYNVYAYLAVGAANTVLNIGLFMLIYFVLSKNQLAVEVATVSSFIITVVTGFWLNKNFAFTNANNEKIETQKQFLKYAIVALQGQFSAYLLTKGMILFLQMNPSVAYGLTAIIMLTINYFLQKYFTFKNKKL